MSTRLIVGITLMAFIIGALVLLRLKRKKCCRVADPPAGQEVKSIL